MDSESNDRGRMDRGTWPETFPSVVLIFLGFLIVTGRSIDSSQPRGMAGTT